MHFMPEDEGYVEKLWPEGYKQVIKDEVRTVIGTALGSGGMLEHVYGQQYTERFADLDKFTSRIAEMLVIGAENGADDAFDDIITAFLYEYPLPEARVYARYLLLPTLPESVRQKIVQMIVDEYGQDEVFIHAYRVGYCSRYRDFGEFLLRVADLAVIGIVNGVDDMLATVYRSFLTGSPLPPARRNARRVKNWFVPPGSVKREDPVRQQTW